MAPRKRRGGPLQLKNVVTEAAPPISTHADNTCGFAGLADEIFLEIVSYIPSVPIPTLIHSESYTEIRRTRHETLLALTQTCRSLRRFFWRYLWQRIEVREGMRMTEDEDDTVKDVLYLSDPGDAAGHKNYAKELVRQMEIVTVRNPHLAQYVNYLDIFIAEYSIGTVVAELARCLTLFSNLHTVQIDILPGSTTRSRAKIFGRAFNGYSYPQIRNVFVMNLSASFIASCPQARRVGFTHGCSMPRSCVQIMMDNCPHLEVLDFPELHWRSDDCEFVVNKFPNLRTIQVTINPVGNGRPSHINVLQKLNHLQTIVITWDIPIVNDFWYPSAKEKHALINKGKETWIRCAEHILIQIQLRDHLEKTLVLRLDRLEKRRILSIPKALATDFGEGNYEP